jgi:hypothetical protein
MRLVGVLCALSLGVAASAEAAPKFKKGPYLQNVAPRAITIAWESGEAATAKLTVTGPGGERVVEDGERERHEIVISDLVPASRYQYVVTSGGVTANGEFATAPETGAQVPISFVVFGDTRSEAEAHHRLVERLRAEVPDFILGTGDMVNDGGILAEWQDFFQVEHALLRDNVLFPAVGNHDRQGRGRTTDHYRRFFAVPENSPDPERYYAFTYAQSRFLVLDSNAYSFALTDQTSWLEQELQAARQDPKIRHVFVTMHHPPYSVSLHGGQRDLRERWTPLFEKYQVTAVFSGHDHVYSRAERDGVRYFVSGGGGAPLYPRANRASEEDREATKYFERVNHYLRVHVFGDFVEITAIRADGTIIETASWGTPPRNEPPRPQVAMGPPKMAVGGPTTPERLTKGLGWPGRIGAGLVVIALLVLWRMLRR